jgi:hypothetical protein
MPKQEDPIACLLSIFAEARLPSDEASFFEKAQVVLNLTLT